MNDWLDRGGIEGTYFHWVDQYEFDRLRHWMREAPSRRTIRMLAWWTAMNCLFVGITAIWALSLWLSN